ncbi:bile acid:sodium symporter [Kiritimatiellota bacterium B12222]|nr:bile acid:sodium symporter [Kiritimatiellota bacterium B12222]
MIRKLKALSPYAFIGGIFLALFLAALFPVLGSAESPLPLHLLKPLGIFLIFFNQGVLLPGEALRKGLLSWKLHLLTQGTLFIWAPLLTSLLLIISSSFFEQSDLRLGFLFLSFLPTTISTAVGLCTMAEGNVSGALFNCSLAAVLGVFIVPLYCLLFMQLGDTGTDIPFGKTLGNVALSMLLPLLIGQCLRAPLIRSFTRHKTAVKRFNNGVILFIVWTAFCASFSQKVWQRVSMFDLALCVIATVCLLGITSTMLWKTSGWLHLDLPSRITAFYCGGEKSLAIGLPMSVIIFGENHATVDLSLVVIPLLIYHPAQMILGGWLAPRFAKKVEAQIAEG